MKYVKIDFGSSPIKAIFFLISTLFYRYLQEYQALGTAGGLYHFRDQILAGHPDYFFVMNADVCGDFPLNEMLEFHKTKPETTYCTILGTEVCLHDV